MPAPALKSSGDYLLIQPPRDDSASGSSKIARHRFDGKSNALKQVGDGVRLSLACFNHQWRVGRQEATDIRGDCAIGGEPVRPAIKRATGIEVAHLGRKAFNVLGAHIWRIGDHQVEAA
ncbi:MAG: hypothetical protein WAL40_13095, partial [Rhodoplanes sp.]